MGLLLRFLAFATFVSLALVTYRVWRQQKNPEHLLVRAFAVASFVIAVFLFHQVLRDARPTAAHAQAHIGAAQGCDIMEKLGCGSCHSVGGGVIVGPDLKLAASKYDHDTLLQFIENPDNIYTARHKHPLNEGFSEMPDLGVGEPEAEAIADYLASVAAQQP